MLALTACIGPALTPLGPVALRAQATKPTTLAGRAVVLDKDGRLLSWVQPQSAAYATIVRLAWEQLLTGFPTESNGLPTWLSYCCFDAKTLRGTEWPHNPACVYAGLTDAAAAYCAYSGDRRVIDFIRRILDYHLANGTTPADRGWAWPSVPYASADHGDVRYRGAHDFRYAGPQDPPKLGRGDGYGVIEPDKVAELGNAYLTAWQLTSDLRYGDAALACARALAAHVRAGDQDHSPWPFRVVAETGFVREEYGTNIAASAAAVRQAGGTRDRRGIGVAPGAPHRVGLAACVSDEERRLGELLRRRAVATRHEEREPVRCRRAGAVPARTSGSGSRVARSRAASDCLDRADIRRRYAEGDLAFNGEP